MRHPVLLWLLESAKLAIRYVLVGCAFIPVGVAYAVWQGNKGLSLLPAVACFGLGLVLAGVVWSATGPKSLSQKAISASPAMLLAITGPAAEHWSQSGLVQIHGPRRSILLRYSPDYPQSAPQTDSRPRLLDWSSPTHKKIGARNAAFSNLSS